MKKSPILQVIAILLFVILMGCQPNLKDASKGNESAAPISKTELENEAWNMEERYWEYVRQIDTVSYKTLWHKDFIGYPSFGDGVSDNSKIASWIPDLHKDPDLKFGYILYKKASNAIGDVVMVFYDTDEIWTDKENKVVRKETYKFTHTWKKIDGHWVILGGMAAIKRQDVLF